MLIRIVSGSLGGRRCSVPDVGVRPTSEKVRAALFDSLASLIDFSETSFVDLFSGSGAMAFEAFSRGFSSVWAVESNNKTIKVITENQNKLLPHNPPNFTLLRGDATGSVLQKIKVNTPTVVFLDPPYDDANFIIDRMFPLLITNNIITKSDIVIVETDKYWCSEKTPFRTKKYGDTLLTWYRGGALYEH